MSSTQAAGSGRTAAVVISRHLNREWQNDRRLRGIAQSFTWTECVLCAEPVSPPGRRS